MKSLFPASATTTEKVAAAGFLGLALFYFTRAARARTASPDLRTDTSSFGPIEQVGPTGNAPPLVPQSGMIPDEGITLPPPMTDWEYVTPSDPSQGNLQPTATLAARCESFGLDTFAPDCLGATWTAFVAEAIPMLTGAAEWVSSGKARKLTPVQMHASLLDPSRTWYGLDYRRVR